MKQTATHPVWEHFSALAEPLRCRMLLALEHQELTVSELCAVVQLPQSTTSHHLKTLVEGGWVTSRREGTNRFYAPDLQQSDAAGKKLWELLRDETRLLAVIRQDEERLKSVLAQRRSRTQEFFSTVAGQWDRMRQELFGATFDMRALPALLDAQWTVGDLGCGTGQIAAVLAPHVHRVVAVDASAEMLAAAKRRLQLYPNVELRQGSLETLPLRAHELDAAFLSLVLHHVNDPASALQAVGRVMKPGGKVVLVDMLPHDREEFRSQMGHRWLGFSQKTVTTALQRAGFEHVRFSQLPPEPTVLGPNLFIASAVRSPSVKSRPASKGVLDD